MGDMMAYCRWSSGDFNCDLYVYQSESGWVIHVAGRRHDFQRDRLPPCMGAPPDPLTDAFDVWWEVWIARHQRVNELVSVSELVPIGLPHDGETFREVSPGEAADRVEVLIQAGYRVPEGVAEDLRAEQLGITREEYDKARTDRVADQFGSSPSQHVRDVLRAAKP